jgi:glycosyltransferase involved in cell wall biosynthesis
LSPAVFRAARETGTATVVTLHNYRTFCAAGIPMRTGRPCTECLDRHSVWPALRYKCYRNSRLATLPVAGMIALHRTLGTWRKDVDAFIALTQFQRDKLVDAGLPAERVYVKPHFYPAPPKPLPWDAREPRAVFIGRLGEEKGLHVLLEAWRAWGPGAPALELIGDGPERTTLEASARTHGLNGRIRFSGQLPFAETQARLARASLLLLPSLCFEGFPMVIREAFALGVPVAASRLGSMPCLVEEGVNGVLFAPGDADDLLQRVKSLWNTPERLATMAGNARADFETKYTEDVNYRTLMAIYESAIAVSKERARRCT